MANKIQNREALISHGDQDSRKIVLDITESVLQKADAFTRIKEMMHMDGPVLYIGEKFWDLSKKRNVYLIGAGKACNAMVMAIEDVLGEYLTEGIAIVKILEPTDHFKKTKVFVGGHPLPNEEGVSACHEILKMVDERTDSEDLYIAVMSGGSTALMCCPIPEITLEDEIITTDILLKSGAKVSEINSVRRHLSLTNGGRLGQRIANKGAELIGIAIYDQVGMPATEDITQPVDMKGTPVGPDSTTFEDALDAIFANDVSDRIPKSVLDYLKNADKANETPKELSNFTYYILNTVPDSCSYAKEAAEARGINAAILTSYLEGDSKNAGTMMASIAREIRQTGSPIAPPCLLISAGETTTLILDNKNIKGHGGPSQELVTSFAVSVGDLPGVCFLSIDSEGTDGTTMAAGGITDSTSCRTAQDMGLDMKQSLRDHSTAETLSRIGDQIITGNTGTNLCDFNLMYVPKD